MSNKSNKMLKKTLLSSALGLLLSFQGVQDASAYVYSYANAGFDGFEYYSADVVLDFTLISASADSEANGVPGYPYSYPGEIGSEADDADMYAWSYALPDDYATYAEATANGAGVSGTASSEAWIEMQFTVVGSGYVEFLGPMYYEMEVVADSGQCGSASSVAEMTISVGAEVESDQSGNISACGSSVDIPGFNDDLYVSMNLVDGASGSIRLYSAAAVSYFADAVELPLPASLGMLALGLLMVGVGRRKLTPSV